LPVTTKQRANGVGAAGRGRPRRTAAALAVIIPLAMVGVAGWIWWRGTVLDIAVREHCSAVAAGRTSDINPDQAGNAAVIAAVAVHRGLPGRAASIGLATALQESKLRNLDYGDRDSLGLFQQRPSQGWGTRDEVLDPVYAANAFYDVLVKVEGYTSLPITKAAQRVQRSAFPTAYGDKEPEARVLASTLTGYSPAGFTCALRMPSGLSAQQPDRTGLTPRAQALARNATRETGRTASPPDPGSDGRQLRYDIGTATGDRDAWSLAHWAVARAQALDVVSVRVADRQWVRRHSASGWTTTSTPLPTGTVLVTVA
jgi:hypothetical protein